MTDKLTLTVDVALEAEHYNYVAQATVPACWTARVIAGLPDSAPYAIHTAYAHGDLPQEAFDILVADLRAAGLTGTIKFVRGHNRWQPGV